MNAHAAIKGWCPTALRPMMSGDGLLVRVRVRDATLSPTHALVLADAAKRFGNGLLELTQRANIQIRGVQPESFPPLLELLSREGLVDMREERAPINILVGPLCGLDARARDMRPLAAAIERGLRSDERFAALPSKFGFALDGGCGRLGEGSADVVVTATGDGHAIVAPAGFTRAARVLIGEAPDAALALTQAFLTLRRDERRMRALAHICDDALFTQARLTTIADRPESKPAIDLLGLADIDGNIVLGVAAPFGAWQAKNLAEVASLALTNSSATIRVTPWRTLLIAGLPSDVARNALRDLAALDLIVRIDDVRLRIAACAGAPACSSGEIQTRAFAKMLAARIPKGHGIAVHLSGCAKGCAYPREAPVTLVGRNGRFDLVVDGRADDAPTTFDLDDKLALETISQQRAA